MRVGVEYVGRRRRCCNQRRKRGRCWRRRRKTRAGRACAQGGWGWGYQSGDTCGSVGMGEVEGSVGFDVRDDRKEGERKRRENEYKIKIKHCCTPAGGDTNARHNFFSRPTHYAAHGIQNYHNVMHKICTYLFPLPIFTSVLGRHEGYQRMEVAVWQRKRRPAA